MRRLKGLLKKPRNAIYVILIPPFMVSEVEPLAGEESKNFNKL
jgi:hypothetical protein